ncbi:MAG: ABC transporter permease [Sphaerochaetaceae bacterium]|nr:ABC transporter permease [Sphaerochaetaceae bacterium]
MKNIIKKQEFTLFVILIIMCIIIGFFNITFFSIENLIDLLKTNLVLTMMAMGMLLVILTGGIDVSVASIISAITVIIGNFLINVSSNLFVVVLVAAISGMLIGLVNGLLIAKLKIPPIVATLGTMNIIAGINLYITNGSWITGVPQNFIDFGNIMLFKFHLSDGRLIGLPIQIIFLLPVCIGTWYVLNKTVIGRGIYALGGNKESAERMGFNSTKVLLFIYTFEGLIIGLAAVAHTSIMRQVDPNAFNSYEMEVIAAVVLGGASTLGGYGSVLGTLIGVALFSVINNGMILMHIPTFWQNIVVGLIIVASVSFDMYQKKKVEKNKVRVDVE